MTGPARTLRLKAAEIAYESWGDAAAPTIVFSHSLFFDRRMFAHQAEALAGDFHVVAYDHRGHGQSGPAADGRYDLEAAAEDAIALILSLGAGRVHFAGNSMGGFVALRVAARRPDLLASAIAIASSGDAEADPERFAPLLAQLEQHGGQGMEDALLGIMFGATSLASEAFRPQRKAWRARMSALPPLIAGPAASVVARGAVNRELARSPVPVLALAGAEDEVYPLPVSQAIAAAAPRGEWAVVAAAGHSVALEQPAEANAAIRAFIARVSAQPAG